jgi:DNA-binding transcriptional LysR family regulator
MELTDLRYFYNVASTRSFARGAALSHVSAPAVSKAVKRLEEQLEAELLVRTTRRVALTDRGEIVMQHCDRLFQQIDALQRDLLDSDDAMQGELRVAANEVFSSYLLPHALAGLVRENPGLEPRCYEMIPEQIAHWLVDGRLDVGFTIGAGSSKQVDVHPIAQSQGVLVAGPDHPLYEGGVVCEEALLAHPSVAPRFFQREYLPTLDQFPTGSLSRRVGCTIELMQMAIQLCLDGAYLGYFPEVAIRCYLSRGELKQLEGLPPRDPFELVALTRKGVPPRGAVLELIETLRVQIEESSASGRQCSG